MEDVLTNVASHGGNSAGDIASKSAQVDNSRGAAAAGCSSGGGQKRKLEQTYLSPRSFEQSRKKEVDVALMELISEAGIPANVVSYNSCEKVFEKAHEYATLTGRAYKPPDRRVFGLDGDALVEGRRRALKEREDVLQKVTEFGNTLCADAMTRRRKLTRSTLMKKTRKRKMTRKRKCKTNVEAVHVKVGGCGENKAFAALLSSACALLSLPSRARVVVVIYYRRHHRQRGVCRHLSNVATARKHRTQ
mmetsp:Transcript_3517/g.8964  ORF Transcript_3517/g.8964 Transcript_3517/m.8964 type:complete len:248 (+) Transcript_3517:424-1167(+)